MWRHIASNAMTFLVVLVFLAGGALLWAQNNYVAEGPLDRAICLQVPSGGSFREVSEDLAARGAVSSAALFRMGADYADKTQALKAGSFLVPEGASMEQIVDIVTRGGASTCGTEVVYRIGVTRASVLVRELDPASNRFVEVARFNPAEDATPEAYLDAKADADTRFNVVVAEGVTSWQIVEELNKIDVLEGEISGLPDEGSLSPDGYEVRSGETRESVIARMQQAQARDLAAAWESRADGLPFDTPEEALVLASIIEKETAQPEERPLMASVFINRLRQGMRLQTDPTIIYGITRGRGPLGRGITRGDISGATETRRHGEILYNTYQINGLPPTPIANPGRASIQAVLNPDQSDYIFFVAKTLNPQDGHNFSETLEQHNAFVAQYRALERARDN